jgi:hypothetical protein
MAQRHWELHQKRKWKRNTEEGLGTWS